MTVWLGFLCPSNTHWPMTIGLTVPTSYPPRLLCLCPTSDPRQLQIQVTTCFWLPATQTLGPSLCSPFTQTVFFCFLNTKPHKLLLVPLTPVTLPRGPSPSMGLSRHAACRMKEDTPQGRTRLSILRSRKPSSLSPLGLGWPHIPSRDN